MLTIVEDTFKEGRHDLQKGMCSRKRFEMVAQGGSKRVFAEGVEINPKKPAEIPDHGCWEEVERSGETVEHLTGRCAEPVQYFSMHAHRSGNRHYVRYLDPSEG